MITVEELYYYTGVDLCGLHGNELTHYGVRGMKWGHRKGQHPTDTGHRQNERSRRRLSPEMKRRLRRAAVVTAASIYGGIKGARYGSRVASEYLPGNSLLDPYIKYRIMDKGRETGAALGALGGGIANAGIDAIENRIRKRRKRKR